MLPSADLGTPRKRNTTAGGSNSGSSHGGSHPIHAFGGGGGDGKQSARRTSGAGGRLATKRAMIVAGAIGSFIILGAVAGAVVGVRAVKSAGGAAASDGSKTLDAAYCDSLPASGKDYCKDYFASAGSGRFAAASQWQKMSSLTCELWGGLFGEERFARSRVAWRVLWAPGTSVNPPPP
jgi:hypothetical protein